MSDSVRVILRRSGLPCESLVCRGPRIVVNSGAYACGQQRSWSSPHRGLMAALAVTATTGVNHTPAHAYLVPRQATFARSESSLADAITRYSVKSPNASRHVMRSPSGRGRGCVSRFLVGR